MGLATFAAFGHGVLLSSSFESAPRDADCSMTWCQSCAQADAFSYGVVLWELITKEQERRGNWRPVRVPDECPAAVEALLVDCLTDDVDRRPSMAEVVERLIAAEQPQDALADMDRLVATEQPQTTLTISESAA